MGSPAGSIRPRDVVLVAAGGFLGAPLRYAIGSAFPHSASAFPFSTFAINVSGAFLLGLLLEVLTRSGDDTGGRHRVRLMVGTGFLGAFTTYSHLALDVDLLVHGGHAGTALAYAIGSVAAGLCAAALGVFTAARVIPDRKAAR